MKLANPALEAVFVVLLGAASPAAWPQQPPKDSGASMAKPPRQTASGTDARNPDPMPIDRPQSPTHDPISHPLPASAAIAK